MKYRSLYKDSQTDDSEDTTIQQVKPYVYNESDLDIIPSHMRQYVEQEIAGFKTVSDRYLPHEAEKQIARIAATANSRHLVALQKEQEAFLLKASEEKALLERRIRELEEHRATMSSSAQEASYAASNPPHNEVNFDVYGDEHPSLKPAIKLVKLAQKLNIHPSDERNGEKYFNFEERKRLYIAAAEQFGEDFVDSAIHNHNSSNAAMYRSLLQA